VGTSQGEGWNTTFENQSLESWERALRINLTAPFQLIQKLLPVLGGEKNSSIINVSSIYGEFAPDWKIYEGTDMSNPAAYSASKGGLLQLTRWLSTTLSPSIRINAVSPGGILRNQHPKFVAAYVEKTPLGRMATEADVVAAILFLASESSCYITGQNIRVNGGWGLS
jgi:NAD(P)-dependent dehydrogenase (short-subunit alcohol dehydrogenase family)